MILTDLTPDIAWIVPWRKLQQLCHLWRQHGIGTSQQNRLYLSGDQLLEAGIALDCEIFQLVLDPLFTALLWGQRQSTEVVSPDSQSIPDDYAVNIAFTPQQVALVLVALANHESQLPQLQGLQNLALPTSSHLPQEMVLTLFDIMRSPGLVGTQTLQSSPSQPLNLLLNQRLEQERILNNLTHRIYQNQDLSVTVRLALERVHQLLKLDRIFVYQLNVATKNRCHTTNRVTFEVLTTGEVQPILYREESLPEELQEKICDHYRQGLHLALDDATVDSLGQEFCVPVMAIAEQPKSVLTVPLLVDNRLWGLLVAHQCSQQRRWRKNEISFLYHVAEYLAIAIFQARSYQELQEQKIHLESLALQRSRELEDALLSAKIASQSKKEFIHIISHELLTPLTSIIGLSNTLSYWSAPENLHKLSAEKRQSYLQTIQESGLKLRNLLQDILDFSQTEAARTLLDIQEFSLKQLCYAVLTSFQEMGDRQGLTLKFVNNLGQEQEAFTADPARLEKMLNHLLSNAIKFTPHGGEVTFTIWREQQQDVLLQIKDTGIGIAPQQMPLLFEKFQQLEPSISRSHDGAGFGLALVKQIVETHQGQIHVTSTPKQGSTFTVRIPCQRPTRGSTEADDLNPVNANLSQGRTVVLISQDEEVALLICDLLTATNYQVIWLMDSTTALGQVTVLQPMLVIVDVQQQDRPVESIISRLQNTPPTHHIPYLLVSDPLPKAIWSQLQSQGCRDYLRKPIHSETLINRVNDYGRSAF